MDLAAVSGDADEIAVGTATRDLVLFSVVSRSTPESRPQRFITAR